jgi:hypothetical protein
MPKSPPSRVLGPLQAGSSPTPHHQRLDLHFTPSTAGFACSGYAGLDFHRTRPTCPQINHRMVMAQDHAPALDIGASYSKLPDAVRIALLPLRTVCQGLKRLQERVQKHVQERMRARRAPTFPGPASSSLLSKLALEIAGAGNKAEHNRQKRNSTFADQALDAVDVSLPAAAGSRLAAVGRTNAGPAVADLLVMHARVVCRGRQLEHDRR